MYHKAHYRADVEMMSKMTIDEIMETFLFCFTEMDLIDSIDYAERDQNEWYLELLRKGLVLFRRKERKLAKKAKKA